MFAITTRTTMVPARPEALRDAREFLEDFCANAGVEREAALKLNLVVEELFTNTVKHGVPESSRAPVWMTLEADAETVRLTYEDHAPPFNPFAAGNRERLAAQADPNREGGLGVKLAHGLAAAADYAYLFGRNRIRLAIAR